MLAERRGTDPDATTVLNWVASTSPKPVVIVDSFAAFLGGDENDAGVVRAFMERLRRLKCRACVIVLHHTGKGESTRDYRGSSDFKASLDVGYTLANFGEHSLERMRLEAFKTRFRTDTDVILNYREGEFIADTSGSAVTKSISAQLTALLRVNPEITTTKFEELAAARGLGPTRPANTSAVV